MQRVHKTGRKTTTVILGNKSKHFILHMLTSQSYLLKITSLIFMGKWSLKILDKCKFSWHSLQHNDWILCNYNQHQEKLQTFP